MCLRRREQCAAGEPEDEDRARQHAEHPAAGRRAAARPRALRRRHAQVSAPSDIASRHNIPLSQNTIIFPKHLLILIDSYLLTVVSNFN